MTNITPLHKNQAGQPSTNGGHFAAAPTKPESGVSLGAEPVMVTVTLQQWVNDYAQEVGTAQFDGRIVLDSLALDRFDPEEADDSDEVFFEAVRLGLTPDHDGPFYVDLDGAADYIEARRDAGQTGPLTAAPRRNLDQLLATRQQLEEERRALDTAEFNLAKEAVENLVLEQFPDAAEIQVLNFRQTGGDDYCEVTVVRGADNKVLWYSDGRNKRLARDWTKNLSLKFESLRHSQDETNTVEWYGIIVER